MTKYLLSIIVLTLFSITPALSQNESLRNDLSKSFKSFSLTRLDTGSLARRAETLQTVSFSTESRTYELRLTPRDLRALNYKAEDTGVVGVRLLPRGAVTTYKGSIDGESGSRVRVTIDDSKIEGFFVSNGDMFFIEPASDYSKMAAPSDFVVYRQSDVLRLDTFTCRSELMERIESGKEMVRPSVVSSSVSANAIEIATEADFDFVTSAGGATGANNKVLSILNMVEGVYENELNLTINVTFQHTYSTPDPLNGASSDALLASFRDFWNANYPLSQYPRDTAHLFTYKPNVRAQGYAYLGVVCNNPAFAYGLSGRVDPTWGWEEANFLVTSHEIAHNIGANHSDTAPNCANSLMQSQLSGSTLLSFCTVSRSEVGSFVGTNGSCLTARSGATPFDFDGDAKSDTTIFRPSNGTWFIANSASGGFSIFQFGQTGDKPVAADYDGDGKTDAAVFRGGVWWRMKSANNTFDSVSFGLSADIPAAGDYDGDGKADVAVFRPSTGVWHRLNSSNGGYSPVQFGANGDVPLPGDYDGDGKADINVFRPSNGVWYRINSANGSSFAVQFGMNGDKPVPGDFDGDGKADIAVYRAATGTWFAQRSTDNGYMVVGFGLSNDVPVAGDYDGDGKSDIAVWRPESGVWHRLSSSSGGYSAYQFGIASDVAVQGR
ncbi:MAG: VCBS repeat-containing protein [Acidobacteria bacterium]|nr:VCBS repeat-containing protein [Acidobacteriota bacterium]